MTDRQRMINRLTAKMILYPDMTDNDINGHVEHLAKQMGLWDWYLNLTDKQYFRMVREAKRNK